jgi:hypothetical protein
VAQTGRILTRMEPMYSKSKIVEVPCPQCSRPTQETAGMLELASCVICAHCGHVIEIDGKLLQSVLDSAIREARGAADDTTNRK